jgi:sulfate-transporting ATPase
VIGGVGRVLGAALGGLFEPGGVGSWALTQVTAGLGRWIGLISGVLLLLTVIAYPDGAAGTLIDAGAWLRDRTAGLRSRLPSRGRKRRGPEAGEEWQAPPRTLELREVDVRFGGVHALDRVSLSVGPGEVVGLIGPNGAGKTTLIDAVTGFAPARGSIRLGDRDLDRLPPHRRAARGLARSWQSLDLFEDLSVIDNLNVAADPGDARSFLLDLVRPRRGGATAAMRATIAALELGPHLDRMPDQLSAGRRRLVAIARAIASEPSVLLLDEPCAGLDERERREVAPVIRGLADRAGIGVLLVEHDVALVRQVADRLVVLDFGTQIAAGPVDEVLADPGVRSAYLGETPDQAAPAGAVTTEKEKQ